MQEDRTKPTIDECFEGVDESIVLGLVPLEPQRGEFRRLVLEEWLEQNTDLLRESLQFNVYQKGVLSVAVDMPSYYMGDGPRALLNLMAYQAGDSVVLLHEFLDIDAYWGFEQAMEHYQDFVRDVSFNHLRTSLSRSGINVGLVDTAKRGMGELYHDIDSSDILIVGSLRPEHKIIVDLMNAKKPIAYITKSKSAG